MALLVYGWISPCPAADSVEAPLQQIQQHISATEKTHDALQTVRDGLDQQLSEIELRQNELARTIVELEQQARTREKRLVAMKTQRDTLQAQVKAQQNLLAGQLRSSHLIGRKDWLKLLLNQEEPSHLARVLAYYGYLNQARSDLIQRCREGMVKVDEAEKALADESRQQSELRKQVQHERALLAEAGKARRQLLSGWDKELSSQAARLHQLREDEQRLSSLIESMGGHVERVPAPAPDSVPAPPPLRLGKPRCPPSGTLLAGFGSARMSGRWDGLLIGGKEGAPVRAVADGRVVFADWFRGYGLLLIVDHGDGVLSLYAFNQMLRKAKGDPVVAGEIVAAIGASGGRDKPGLYFGIRENGKPVDPVRWCAGRSLSSTTIH